MRSDFFPRLGAAIRTARHHRGHTQSDLAARLGRSTARISELERDLLTNRLGKDRLTLLANICDALDLVPVLMPRDQAPKVGLSTSDDETAAIGGGSRPSVFNELFVDLSDDAEDEDEHG